MNKAFVKDPEPLEPTCPAPEGCGGTGEPVSDETLAAWLTEDLRASLAHEAYWCTSATCEVAWFDAWGTSIPITVLRHPVWPKHPESPVCPCFGMTADDIETDARNNDPTRLRSLIEKSESPAAACLTKTPSGQCCIPEVRRLYMRWRVAPEEDAD